MVVDEVFANCYNFNPIREKHASIHEKCTNTQVKKLTFKVFITTIQSRGRCRSWSRNRSSYLICGSAEPEEIFSAPQHWTKIVSITVSGFKSGDTEQV
jgi:hypothetical protein